MMLKKIPWLGLTLGLLFSLVLYRFSLLNDKAAETMPALASLFMAEIGFLLTAYAAFIGGRELRQSGMNLRSLALFVGNVLLAINFIILGLALWQRIQLS